MRAVVFAGDGRVRVEDVPEPALQDPADALVRVRRAGVCGTDLHLLAHPEGLGVGVVLGHEFAGEVVAAGPEVRTLAAGDAVAGADYTACGRCWWCRHGDHWECAERRFFGTGTTFGPPLAGAQAELVRVPFADTVLRRLPAGVTLDVAVYLGDALATGYAAVRRGGIRPGDTVAVVGGGPVGQLTSVVAQACGAGVVVVVEPVAARRALAAAEGATAAEPGRAREAVDAVTEGRGADVVIDAVGAPIGLGAALALVRRRGTVVAVGVPADREWPLAVADAFAAELTLRFAVGDLMRDGDDLAGLLAAGAVDPTVLGAEQVPLADAPEAYQRMSSRRSLKTVFTV